jgi:hypothetical protein
MELKRQPHRRPISPVEREEQPEASEPVKALSRTKPRVMKQGTSRGVYDLIAEAEMRYMCGKQI